MTDSYNYDVLIIGAGPGGYVAGIRAAQLGKKVALVEKGSVGGVCLNIGCIPTKAIIHQAEIYRNRAKLTAMGVTVDNTEFNYENVFKASRAATDTLCKGVTFLLKKNRIDVIAGVGRIISEHEVSVHDTDGATRTVSAGAIIIATGSRPKQLPGLPFDGKNILSSDDALMMKELPRRTLIVGAGVVGIEFAHILNSFGTEVYVVDVADNILPFMDGEVTDVLKRSLAKRGVKFYTSSKVSSYDFIADGMTATVESADTSGNKTELAFDKIFVMAGRVPNTENIGLDTVGIDTSETNGFISTGGYYQTTVPSVYAIGDVVASSPQLAHVASGAGEIAAEHIAGKARGGARIDADCVPSVVFCEPQVASFGLSEEQAVSRGIPFKKSAFPFRGCGKAVACGEFEGMVKVMADPHTKKLIAAHIVGSGASELIHELMLARHAGIGLDGVAEMIHAHPTLSESIMEAARAFDGRAIHV